MSLKKKRGPWATTLTWENYLQIDKQIWLSQCWLRENKNFYLLYVNWMVLHLNKLEYPSPKDALCQAGLKLQWFLKSRFFKISSIYFSYFVIISPWKRAGLFIWGNLNPLYPTMLCAKFGWNWPGGSGEEDENLNSLRQQQQWRQQRGRRRWRQQQRGRTTDKLWSEKVTCAFGSGELKTSSFFQVYFEKNNVTSNYVNVFCTFLYISMQIYTLIFHSTTSHWKMLASPFQCSVGKRVCRIHK